jgi:molybdopterin/thiamine biosynthesis adenylyltransferase
VKLNGIRIAVIGCGSIGSRIATHLARAGVAGLLLCDPKKFKNSSVATHEVTSAQVGKFKAVVTARRCKAISPHTRVLEFSGPVEELPLSVLADVDLVVMAPDLLSAEVLVAQRCLWLGKPLLQASVHGATLTVQIRFFLNAGANGPCPACAYSRAEWELLGGEVRFSCDGFTAEGAARPRETTPTNSLSALCSMAADFATLQVVRHVVEAGKPVGDTMVEYCGFTHRIISSPLVRSAGCLLDHTSFRQVRVGERLLDLSPSELARRAFGTVTPTTSFEVPGAGYVEFAACACAALLPIGKFVRRGRVQRTPCRRCSAPVVPLGFYTHGLVSAALLGEAIDRPLKQLGVARAPGVVVRQSDAAALVTEEAFRP